MMVISSIAAQSRLDDGIAQVQRCLIHVEKGNKIFVIFFENLFNGYFVS